MAFLDIDILERPNAALSSSSIRPPLNKKSFLVGRVGKKTASQEVGIFYFFFPDFIFYELDCTGGGSKKKKKF